MCKVEIRPTSGSGEMLTAVIFKGFPDGEHALTHSATQQTNRDKTVLLFFRNIATSFVFSQHCGAAGCIFKQIVYTAQKARLYDQTQEMSRHFE